MGSMFGKLTNVLTKKISIIAIAEVLKTFTKLIKSNDSVLQF